MIDGFRTYFLAVEFHKGARTAKVPAYLRNQWLRASSSIVLNLGEGHGKFSRQEKARYFEIAFGSLRECQSILDLCDAVDGRLMTQADHLGACLYRLLKALRG
jgi:four helix bundle protein